MVFVGANKAIFYSSDQEQANFYTLDPDPAFLHFRPGYGYFLHSRHCSDLNLYLTDRLSQCCVMIVK